jgi:ribulose-5-phosphate 4-epimerase/fuculose-1-phosphate aldolase
LAAGATAREENSVIGLRNSRAAVLAAAVLAAQLSGAAAQPTMPSAPATDAERIQELVLANRILANEGIVDGFGHVSVRSAKNPTHFFMSRSRAPALVEADDVMEFDQDSKPVDARDRRPYGERFIHGEVFRARPDVIAVVHSHSPGVIPFGVSAVPLRPISHMAGFLIRAVPVFEIRDTAGEDNIIIVGDNATGAALAKVLGVAPVVLMRGHGDTVVGTTVKQAVFRAIYTEVNARLESEALRLGAPTFLNEKEAARIAAINDSSIDRPWEIWKARAEAAKR